MASEPVPTIPRDTTGGGSGTVTHTPLPPPADPTKAARDAERRANARADAERRKTGRKYLDQAKNLQVQADALKTALTKSFASNRDIKLADITQSITEQIALLKSTTGKRAQTFLDSAADTEKATGDNAQTSLSNLVRERQDALAGILQQGAGETDTMRAMLMSARNWSENAQESNRAYFDSMRSINTGITDLNADAQTAYANAYRTAEGERAAVWDDFYRKRSESYTQLGNIYGTQAGYYAEARSYDVGAPKGAEKAAKAGMKNAYEAASKEAGKAYDQAGLPDWVKNYQGQAQLQTRRTNTNLAAAVTIGPAEKAEGSSLRRWEG
jgi:hypothetical protein